MRRVSRGALLLWSVAVVAAVGIFTVLVAFAGDRVRPAEAPQDAWQRISLRVERPIRGRLSYGSRYRPCPEAAAICGPLPSPSSPEFVDASVLLARLGREAALDAETLHAEALARLAVRGARSTDVLPRLEAAAALAPSDPRIAADLLAVRLAHAEDGQSSGRSGNEGNRQVQRAVSEAVRLAEVAAEEPAVWFNYGLVFETVGLPQTAANGWRRFLELEPEGPWAEEARQQIAAPVVPLAEAPPPPDLREELVIWAEAHPREARSYLERDLLATWAADPEGAVGVRALALAGFVADVTARQFGDSIVADTLGVIRSARTADRRRIADAFGQYFAGLDAYGEQHFTGALAAFSAARSGLDGVGFGGWADYRIAACLYGLDRFAEAGALLRGMSTDPERHQALESRRLWLLALVEASLGRLRDSVDLTEQALEILVRHPDRPAIASMHVNIAAPLDQLSRHDRAWFHRIEGLRASARLPDHRLRHVALLDAATRLIAVDDPDAALPFLVELWRNAVAWDAIRGVPTARLEAALLHAAALSSAGRHADAAEQLERAVEAAGELQDANRVERLSADIRVERAEILMAVEPARALADLDRALATFREFGYSYPLVRVHRLRGEAAERLGRNDLASEAYRAAVTTHEAVLANLEEPDHRAGYLAHAAAAYDSLLRHLAIEEVDLDGAFAVLEKSRSVWAVEQTVDAIGLRDLQAALPVDGAVVAYRVLADEVLVWWAEPGERELLVLPGGRREIVAEIARHEAEMGLAAAPLDRHSATAALYARLLRPLEERLQGVRRLAILPDRLLNRVAFAALVDPRSGRSLLDAVEALSLLPSAHAAIDAPRRSTVGGLVAVGDPAFDRAVFPSLDPLPAAAREAREVAALYAGSVVLLGEDARPARIQQELRGRRTLHYAGHAVFDPIHPERSGLVLAPDRGHVGVLTIGELEHLSLSGLDLVVLSACSTSGGERSASQDWAAALLGVGVRGVVANLWEVEDDSARRFILRFHEHRVAGLSNPQALLAAQRDFRNEPPSVWAGFGYYGSID